MDKKELEYINAQITALKKQAYGMLKALCHLSDEINKAQKVEEKKLIEHVIPMDIDGKHKLKIYIDSTTGHVVAAKPV